MNITILETNDKKVISTLPIYGSTVCAWNISAINKDEKEAIFIRIEEI